MTKNKALGKNYGALTIIQASNFLLPFLTLPFIVRTIGPERFGAINFSIAIVTYFILLINFGFDFTATRRVAQNRQDENLINSLFSQIFYSRVILFALSILLFSMLFVSMPQINQHPIVSIFIFTSCLANVFTPNWLFQGMQIIHKTAVFNFIAKLVWITSGAHKAVNRHIEKVNSITNGNMRFTSSTPSALPFPKALAWICTEVSIMLCLFIVLRRQKIHLIDSTYFNMAYLQQAGKNVFSSLRKKQ